MYSPRNMTTTKTVVILGSNGVIQSSQMWEGWDVGKKLIIMPVVTHSAVGHRTVLGEGCPSGAGRRRCKEG